MGEYRLRNIANIVNNSINIYNLNFAMHKTRIEFKCPEYYDLETTCHAHGWKSLSPFSWNDSEISLEYAINYNGVSVDVMTKQIDNCIEAELFTHKKLNSTDRKKIEKMIIRSLGLNIDVGKLLSKAEKIGPAYKKLVLNGSGRLLRSPSIWEDTVKTLFTTNCTWALTKKMCESACSKIFSHPTPNGKYPFPSPKSFLKYVPEVLQEIIPVGYRADYLWHISKSFSEKNIFEGLEDSGFDRRQSEVIFNDLRGFGRYATTHMLILIGYYDFIPIDTEVTSFLKSEYRVRKPESFIKRHYKKWGDQMWWGYKFDRMLKKLNWLGD